MQKPKKHASTGHWRTAGNLALADGWLEKPAQPHSSLPYQPLRLVPPHPAGQLMGDPRGATKGILIGVSLSVIVWSLLLLLFGVTISPFVSLAAVIVLLLVT